VAARTETLLPESPQSHHKQAVSFRRHTLQNNFSGIWNQRPLFHGRLPGGRQNPIFFYRQTGRLGSANGGSSKVQKSPLQNAKSQALSLRRVVLLTVTRKRRKMTFCRLPSSMSLGWPSEAIGQWREWVVRVSFAQIMASQYRKVLDDRRMIAPAAQMISSCSIPADAQKNTFPDDSLQVWRSVHLKCWFHGKSRRVPLPRLVIAKRGALDSLAIVQPQPPDQMRRAIEVNVDGDLLIHLRPRLFAFGLSFLRVPGTKIDPLGQTLLLQRKVNFVGLCVGQIAQSVEQPKREQHGSVGSNPCTWIALFHLRQGGSADKSPL
jgi:hypothetical protein